MIIKNIQVLRAFAALSVLFLHTVYAVNDYNFFQLTKNFSSWGDFDIDIFFIIWLKVSHFSINEAKFRKYKTRCGQFL